MGAGTTLHHLGNLAASRRPSEGADPESARVMARPSRRPTSPDRGRGGVFVGAEQVGTGHNCLLGMVMHTTHDRFFLKGVPADHKRAVWTQSNEAAINPHIRHVSAPLAFHVAADGWDVLGFRYLDAQHADLSPGSLDLPKITASLRDLTATPAPDGLMLRTAEDRWRDYAGDHAHLLAGTTVAHTDLHRHNILIDDAAKFIDWAWPTLAAPWFDTACVGLQLIHAGHTPKEAELWCQDSPPSPMPPSWR
ncbi:hypothetical protein ACFQZ4_19235 [Catellatospora coxensis]